MIAGLALAFALTATDRDEFSSWKLKYGKMYKNKDEHEVRLNTFVDNKALIAKLNAASPKTVFAMNRFGDLSPKEFKARYNGFSGDVRKERANVTVAKRLDVSAAPASFDWRDKRGVVAPVQDQAQCGSCWAFSAVANMESRAAIKNGGSVQKLSEQYIVDCDKSCGTYRFENGCDAGCEGGLQPGAFKYAIANGVPSESSYPYSGADGTCDSSQSVVSTPRSWEFVADDEGQIAAYVAANSPVSVAVDAANWQFYSSGVMSSSSICPASSDPESTLDHGVVIVGYGTDSGQDYWIIRNSWASSWGENGYCRIARGQKYCGIDLFACSAIF